MRHTSPFSVQTIALSFDRLAAQVKVQSTRGPRRQLRPNKVLITGFAGTAGVALSRFNFDLDGERGAVSSMRQTLTCLVPTLYSVSWTSEIMFRHYSTYVTKALPIQIIWRTLLVHLLVECNRADPFLWLMDQIYRKPSFIVPRLATHRESGLKATQRMPKLCSDKDAIGISEGAPLARENIRTLGV